MQAAVEEIIHQCPPGKGGELPWYNAIFVEHRAEGVKRQLKGSHKLEEGKNKTLDVVTLVTLPLD